jgi:hypothetical protein
MRRVTLVLAAAAVLGFLAANAFGDDRDMRRGYGSGGATISQVHGPSHGHHGPSHGHHGHGGGYHGSHGYPGHYPPVIIRPPCVHQPVYPSPWVPPMYGYPRYGHGHHGHDSGFYYRSPGFGFSFSF